MSQSSRRKAEAFLAHLEPLQPALEAFCRRSLRDPEDVADALQSAVAAAFRDFDRYAEGTNFRAWIFRYTQLECLNRNRKTARDRHAPLPADLGAEDAWEMILDEPLLHGLLEDPDAVLDRCDAELADAILELEPVERSVFLLKAVGEFKYREIAEIVAIPLGTVMSSLARTRLRLRRQLVQLGEARGLLHRGEVQP